MQRRKRLLTEHHIGQNTITEVPEFGNERGIKDGLYEVGCREGRLISRFTTTDLDHVSGKVLSPKEVSDVKKQLRRAASKVTAG